MGLTWTLVMTFVVILSTGDKTSQTAKMRRTMAIAQECFDAREPAITSLKVQIQDGTFPIPPGSTPVEDSFEAVCHGSE